MIKKAKIEDAQAIYKLIHAWAKQKKVLPRSLNYIYENIRDFWIYEKNKKIYGCCALHIVGWQNLGEIKSLIVDKHFQNQGIGILLTQHCINEAKTLGVKTIFALTFVPAFFKKLGFKLVPRIKLPHKIWTDCVECVYFPNCKEKAVILTLKKT